MGLAVARGDFGTGTVAAFKCTPVYLHNHGHRDANSFTIYHKGEQAVDSGAYDGYETPHWYNYYVRTIAHNTIVVHDPDEPFVSRGKAYANDGGQRFINEPRFQALTIEQLCSDAFRDGRIVAYREADGFSYVCGDASNCYRPEKLARFLRHVTFVLDWPAKGCVSMVVLDELELHRPGLEPRFLLHTMDEPVVGANCITARHGGGRLTTTVLLPASPRIEAVGGPGREFEVDGRNFPLGRQLGDAYTPGAWRAEVSGGGGAGRTRTFLTLLVPADVDAPPEPEAHLEAFGDDGWTVRQGELSVVLARGGGRRVESRAGRTVRVELAG
jgi:heparin/heparan-sulfate lyase